MNPKLRLILVISVMDFLLGISEVDNKNKDRRKDLST